jgi:hypothetical protein
MIDFSCINPFSGEDLCFGGGSCTLNSTRIECHCPDGQGPDRWIFHFDNCIAPTNSNLVFLILFTATALPISLFHILYIQSKLKRELAKLGRIVLVWTWIIWALVLSVYLQDGCYESCGFFFPLVLILISIIAHKLVLLVMTPVMLVSFPKSIVKLRLAMQTFSTIECAGYIAIGVSMMVTTRGSNVQYNTVAVTFTTWFLFFRASSNVLIISGCYRLENDLRNTLVMEQAFVVIKESHLIQRIWALRIATSSFLPMLASLCIAVPAVTIALGSFPGFFIVMMILLYSVMIAINGAVLYFAFNPHLAQSLPPGPTTISMRSQ